MHRVNATSTPTVLASTIQRKNAQRIDDSWNTQEERQRYWPRFGRMQQSERELMYMWGLLQKVEQIAGVMESACPPTRHGCPSTSARRAGPQPLELASRAAHANGPV